MHVGSSEYVCMEKEVDKSTAVAHFQSCLDFSASLDQVSVRTKPLWSVLYEVSIRLRFCYCPLVRSRACMAVRSGCLCPLPSGLLPVTHGCLYRSLMYLGGGLYSL